MTPPRKKVDNSKAIETGKHGLIISKGITGGALLLQASPVWGWNRADFLNTFCLKAGLHEGAWKAGPEFYVFSSQIFREQEKLK
jgi:AMMECR1 domain-containing protein